MPQHYFFKFFLAMADLEIDDDVRERFAYLFKPVTDFAKNFEIDIIELLQEYDNRTLSSDTGYIQFVLR